MNARTFTISLVALIICNCSITLAAPNPNPIDAGTAHAVAINDDLACSVGSCGVNTQNQTIAEKANSTTPDGQDNSSTSGAFHTLPWTPLSLFAAGSLVFSTGML